MLQNRLDGAVAGQILEALAQDVTGGINEHVLAAPEPFDTAGNGLFHFCPTLVAILERIRHRHHARPARGPVDERPVDLLLIRERTRGKAAEQFGHHDHGVHERRMIGQEEDPRCSLGRHRLQPRHANAIAQAQQRTHQQEQQTVDHARDSSRR